MESVYVCGPLHVDLSPTSLLDKSLLLQWAADGDRSSLRSSLEGGNPDTALLLSEADKAAFSPKQLCSLFHLGIICLHSDFPRPGHTSGWAESGNQLVLTPLLHPGILLAHREEAARGSNYQIKDSTFALVFLQFGGPLQTFLHQLSSSVSILMWVSEHFTG